MSWIAVGVIAGSSLLGAAGSVIGANKQASAQEQAAGMQKQMFDTINQQEQPFIQGGYRANNTLQQLLGLTQPTGKGRTAGLTGLPGDYLSHQFTPQDFLSNLDPGYQFQLQTGAQALRNQNTPGVGALSGQTLKDLMSFNQGMAGTAYQNAFNRYTTQQNNIFSRLSQIAGLGQNAATQVGNAGSQLGVGQAQATAAAGGSLAGGIVGATNAIGGNALPLAYYAGGGGGGGFSPSSGWGSGTNANSALSQAGFGDNYSVAPIAAGS